MEDKTHRMQELIDSCLSDDAVNEYDSIIKKYRRRRLINMTAFCAAACLMLFFIGSIAWTSIGSRLPSKITPVAIFETLDSITELGMDDINVLTIEPKRNSAVITAEFKDGTVKEYLLKQGEGGSYIEITAQNQKQ